MKAPPLDLHIAENSRFLQDSSITIFLIKNELYANEKRKVKIKQEFRQEKKR